MSELPDFDNLLLELSGGWLTIWLNRPEARNALSQELRTNLRQVLLTVRDDRSIRGITLRGKGGVFCAGGDLKGFRSNYHQGGQNTDVVAASSRAGGEMFNLLNEMPQVVVVLVQGAAIAGGLGMACVADMVVVTKDARFAMTETTLGIPPAQIAPLVVQRLGLRTARRLMLTAARFDGVEAGRLGLADCVVDDLVELERVEAGIRGQVMRCAPGANAATKRIVLATRQLDRDAMLDYAARSFAECMLSDEGREGVSAFLDKRKPVWAA